MAKKVELDRRCNREGSFEKLPSGLIACKIRFVDKRTSRDRTVKRTGKTPGEAKKNALAAIKTIEDGNEHRKRDRLTVYEWLERWLEEYQKPDVSASTYGLCERCLRIHIKPRMSDILLSAVTTDDIQGMYAELSKEGKTIGLKDKKILEGLSPNSVRKVHNMMRKAFAQAVKQGMIPKNPILDTKPAKVIREEVHPMTEEQARAVLRQAKDDRLYVAFLTAFATGLRRGELIALTWDDIDLDKGTAKIWRQITRLEKKVKGQQREPIYSQLKTARSRRTVPISKDVVAELKKHKARQAAEKMEAYNLAACHAKNYGAEVDRSRYYQDTGLVFCSTTGAALDPNSLARIFYGHLKNAKLPHFRFHDIRHTFATLALSKGEPIKKVSAILGHANISITLEIYAHLVPSLMESSVLEGIFTKPEGVMQKVAGEIKPWDSPWDINAKK